MHEGTNPLYDGHHSCLGPRISGNLSRSTHACSPASLFPPTKAQGQKSVLANDHFITEAFVEYTQESLTEQRFTQDLDYDDITIGQTLFNAHRRRADHSEEEDLSSCLSSSMSHDRTVKPVVCRDISHAQGHEIQRQNTKSEQIRTLMDRQREQILGECQAEIRKHEFQADYDRRRKQKLSETIESQQEELHRAQAGERRRQDHQLLHEQLLKQNWDLREAHEKSLNEMKELNRFQGSTFDTIARRRLVEDEDTILELTGKIQELQNEINCMNDSRDFQDAESVRSEHSHVTSQLVSFQLHPIPGGMLSRSTGMPSRKDGPPSIWDTHGISGNVFASPVASSSGLSAGIESMEFSYVGNISLITGGEE